MLQGLLRRIYTTNSTSFWLVFTFIIWIFVFFGFLSSKLALVEDAISYHDHTKFFIENLVKGVFPLWDPFWNHGAPNALFLRRIGVVNPFYFIILLFEAVGVSYTLAYLWFLALYYWAGMIGFYLLAMHIYNNRLIAYGGYLMLLFSALGTRLFDSYMMLVTVPLIWFFYFLVAFTQDQRKHFFLGICLSFMILCNTYIPFYFLLSFCFFIFFFFLFYFKQIFVILRRYIFFIRTNKILVISSLLVVVLSFAPLLTFFHDSNKGHIVLTGRQGGKSLAQVLAVPHRTLEWGAVEDLLYSAFFSDLSRYKFAVIYIPLFAVIVFGLGLFCRNTRRAAFMFVSGLALLCCIVPYGLPFYDFFYKHVFFLKYFRNLHFFLWFSLIPLFVLLVLEHWKMIQEVKSRNKKVLFVYVLAVHLLVLFIVCLRGDVIVSTYVAIILSLLFWSLTIFGFLRSNFWKFVLLTLTILIQPLQVYYYFALRAQRCEEASYGYNFPFTKVELKGPSVPEQKDSINVKWDLYYASANFSALFQNVNNYTLSKYLQYKFILVDSLRSIDRNRVNYSLLEENFLKGYNQAFVFGDNLVGLKIQGNDPNPPIKRQPISTEDANFKILSFDANRLKIALDIPYEKFLIYNDSYDSFWHVKVNGQERPLYQTNIAFKGVWIPAGKSVVEFYYGNFWQYAMNIFFLSTAFVFLFGIIWFAKGVFKS